jgi:hypothetical protein
VGGKISKTPPRVQLTRIRPYCLNLSQQKKWTDAEPVLRNSLTLREKKLPDDWRTFNTKAMLGGALLGQKKHADAEPLLLKGYEGMKARENTIPPQGMVRLTEALERLVQLYQVCEVSPQAAILDERIHAGKWRGDEHLLSVRLDDHTHDDTADARARTGVIGS